MAWKPDTNLLIRFKQWIKRIDWLGPVGQGLAFFIGAFSLLNILGELLHAGFDANLWWIDLRPLSKVMSMIMLTGASVMLICYAIYPRLSPIRKRITIWTCVLLLMVCLINIIIFLALLTKGAVSAAFPVPFSLMILLSLIVVLKSIISKESGSTAKRRLAVAALTVLTAMILFPLGQMFCFGKTDYRRKADVIVVFGARAYADGRCSNALADRVRTGCQLYKEGFADTIIFSGGPGDGDIHETEAMQAMAIDLGVPPQAIMLDKQGLNTQATADNTCRAFADRRITRVLTVSHFYHLPRIKMTYQRNGLEVFTVPAKESRTLIAMPKYILREIAALWAYYLRPLA